MSKKKKDPELPRKMKQRKIFILFNFNENRGQPLTFDNFVK